jgi:hypothetical protein
MAVAVNPGTVVQRAGQHASLLGLRQTLAEVR